MITLHKTNISHQTGKGKSSSKGALVGDILGVPAEVPISRTTHQPKGLCIKHIVKKIKPYTNLNWLTGFLNQQHYQPQGIFQWQGRGSLKDVGIPCRKCISGPQSAGMSFQSSWVSQFKYKHSIAYVQICACTLRINIQ